MKMLGFTVGDKEIDPSPKSLDKRKKRESFILREDFLNRYLIKNDNN